MRTLATAILGAAMFLVAQAPITPACAAAAVRAPSLTAVSFTPRKDSLEFVFRAQAPITADQVSVYGDADDAEVLNLKIEGAAVTRRWVTMPDAQIDRALLHPSAGNGDAAVLRIRMQSKSAVAAEKSGEPVVLSISPDEKLLLDKDPVELNALKAALAPLLQRSPVPALALKADTKVSYGFVIKVLDALRDAGVKGSMSAFTETK
jgi:hypothetical protein